MILETILLKNILKVIMVVVKY